MTEERLGSEEAGSSPVVHADPPEIGKNQCHEIKTEDNEKFYNCAKLNFTCEQSHDTMETSLLYKAEVNDSSYLRSNINLDSSVIGSAST